MASSPGGLGSSAFGVQTGWQTSGSAVPKCVTRAFDDTEKYALNIPLGDVLVESMQDKPNWYVAFPPVGGGKESGTGYAG